MRFFGDIFINCQQVLKEISTIGIYVDIYIDVADIDHLSKY